jgi:transaldolase
MTREVFIDTASLEELVTWLRRGIVDGITTNQKIFLTEGRINFRERVVAICDAAPNVPVSVELTERGVGALVSEATTYASWRPNIVIKVGMTVDGDGLEVVAKLARAGFATNATLMMTAEQLLLAARAGATYISLFVNRARDAGEDPYREIAKARRFLDAGRYQSKIIAGSIRAPKDVGEAYDAGADIVTIPPKILAAMLNHPKTAETAQEFDAAWAEFRQGTSEPRYSIPGNDAELVIAEPAVVAEPAVIKKLVSGQPRLGSRRR